MFKPDHLRVFPLLLSLGVMAPAWADAPEQEAESAPVPGSVAASEQGLLTRLRLTLGWESDVKMVSPGAHAETWLALQREGVAASGNPQAASAVQREKAAERFLKTYDNAIKESIYGSGFKSGGGN